MKKNHSKSWDPVWEKIFSSREWGKYPPEELIRFTAQQFYKTKNRQKINFLDLGCGTGSCSWYLAKEGFTVYGVDGSKTAISKAKPNGKLFFLMSAVGSYNGPFKGKGYNHFFKLAELKKLFKIFNVLSIEQSVRTMDNRKHKIINWIVTCKNS